MLAAVSGLCRDRKSDTSILAKLSAGEGLVAGLLTTVGKVRAEDAEVEEEVGIPSPTSPTLEEDGGRQSEGDEVGGCCGGSWGWGSVGGGGSGGCCGNTALTVVVVLFEFLSLAESLQAQ